MTIIVNFVFLYLICNIFVAFMCSFIVLWLISFAHGSSPSARGALFQSTLLQDLEGPNTANKSFVGCVFKKLTKTACSSRTPTLGSATSLFWDTLGHNTLGQTHWRCEGLVRMCELAFSEVNSIIADELQWFIYYEFFGCDSVFVEWKPWLNLWSESLLWFFCGMNLPLFWVKDKGESFFWLKHLWLWFCFKVNLCAPTHSLRWIKVNPVSRSFLRSEPGCSE